MNENNKKKAFLAVGISLAFHVTLLIIALNMVIIGFTFAPRESSSLIHVKIDSRTLTSRPQGEALEKANQEPRMETPQLGPPEFTTTHQGEDMIAQNPSTIASGEPEKIIISDKSSVEVVLEKTAEQGSAKPSKERVPQSRLVATENVLKEFVPSTAESMKESQDLPKSFAEGADKADTGLLSFSSLSLNEDSKLQGAPKHNLQIPFESKINTKDIKANK